MMSRLRKVRPSGNATVPVHYVITAIYEASWRGKLKAGKWPTSGSILDRSEITIGLSRSPVLFCPLPRHARKSQVTKHRIEAAYVCRIHTYRNAHVVTQHCTATTSPNTSQLAHNDKRWGGIMR